jgi:hypothetical protein
MWAKFPSKKLPPYTNTGAGRRWQMPSDSQIRNVALGVVTAGGTMLSFDALLKLLWAAYLMLTKVPSTTNSQVASNINQNRKGFQFS